MYLDLNQLWLRYFIVQDTTFGDKGGIPRMTTHGNIGEFNRAKEDWVSYCERMQQYFMVNDIATDDLRRKQFAKYLWS